ncbi:MAG: hemolysin family protein [Bacteroidetes bacterium]|nr:hemolysin family protein [Bacteroidota bacterium]MBU1579858.1 hemolysin family protein [Bacteroidota bacterium]MBU2556913.1 hemolysin family protein [Bacteroidota bacterium]
MLLLVLYLLLALVVSFLCSILEAVLLSAPVPYLRTKSESGSKLAADLLGMKGQIDKPLSAILSLNTVAHTVGAAGVGAQATLVFGEVYFGVVSAVLTLLILIFTEIIPKTIGARYWRNLLGFTYYTIRVLVVLAYPLVVMSSLITNLFAKQKAEQTISREELGLLADIGNQEGVLGEQESRIIKNIISLRQVKVADIMTPRVVVAAADETLTMADFGQDPKFISFTRIPIYHENIEHINGYIFRQAVFEQLAEDHHDKQIAVLKRTIVVVPESIPVLSLWDQMVSKREHIALVVDEYGGTAGIVTMEDIIETLLGFEIMDERDAIQDMQQYARDRWKKRQ